MEYKKAGATPFEMAPITVAVRSGASVMPLLQRCNSFF